LRVFLNLILHFITIVIFNDGFLYVIRLKQR